MTVAHWPRGCPAPAAGNREPINGRPSTARVVSEQSEVDAVAAILEDETARRILLETRTQPMSADALSERCGVSESTVYRRIEDLRDLDLLVERTHPDEAGHHYNVYAATLDRIVIDVTDDGFDVEVSRREGMVERFTRLVEEI